MKSMILAAVTVVSLGLSVAALAQGAPNDLIQRHYGAAWAASQAKCR
jgi:hypothetical protein